MPTDAPFSRERPQRTRPARLAALAVAILAVLSGAAVLARKPIAEYMIEDALTKAGLSGASLNVARLSLDGLTIEDLTAQDGALRIARIDAVFTPSGLLRSRIDALEVNTLAAALSWREDGLRLGNFPLRPSDEPLSLPDIRRLTLTEGALTIAAPTTQLQAPFSLSAEAADGGWRAAVKAKLTGTGVNVAVDWNGVIAPLDPAQSAGQGTFEIDIDGLKVPGFTDRLDAEGLVTLSAGDGALALTVNKPLTFSFDAPPLGVQSLGTLPWSITIAPSASQAALALTTKDGARALRFDLAATALAGNGRLRVAAAGGGTQTAGALPRFELARGRAEIENFPAGGGAVSGAVNLSDFAGTLQDARGRVEATAMLTGVAVGETKLGQAQVSFDSAVHVLNGTATLTLKTLQTDVARAVFAGWTLAAPARLGLTAGEHTLSIGALSGINGALALSLPALSLAKEDVSVEAQAPDIKLSAKGSDLKIAAARVALRHPAAEIRDARFEAAYDGGKLSGKSTMQIVRLGPPPEDERTQTGALTATANLTTRGDDLDLKGTLTASSGAALGTYSARIAANADRGTAALSIPKKKFERGGKFDSADIGFVTAVSDLTGTIGLDAKASWNGARRTETAVATLEDVGFAVGDVSVAGLSATIDLAGLRPLRSAAPHHVTIQSVAAGLPLTNLAADIVLNGDETATVTRGSLDIAGGQITMADASIPLDGRDGAFALGVQKIDMAQLAARAKVDGLSVTGTLSGAVPLKSDKTGLHFADGTLRADAPGRLVYKPAAPPDALAQNQGGALLLQALSNFAYDRLSIGLNGPVTEDIVVGVSLAGRNPDLYGGYPIEFNLNLSGRLTQILKQGLVGYGIPADIEQQIRGGQKTPGG